MINFTYPIRINRYLALNNYATRKGADELDENGFPTNPWGVDYSKYVPDLIVYCQQLKKSVQELNAITDLQQQTIIDLQKSITALNAKVGI